jgi:hypothetical protein
MAALVAAGLVAAGCLTVGPAAAKSASAADDLYSIDAWAPDHGSNATYYGGWSPNTTQVCSSSLESEGYGKAKLWDRQLAEPGQAANGWLTADGATATATTPAACSTFLSNGFHLKRVVLFPLGHGAYGEAFPVEYSVVIRSGNASSTVLYDSGALRQESLPTEPVVIDLPADLASARYVTLNVRERRSSGSGYAAGLAEIGVYSAVEYTSEYAPAGAVNLAESASVTASHSHELPIETHGKAFLNDGLIHPSTGWVAGVGSDYSTNTTPTELRFWLAEDCAATVSSVAVFPRNTARVSNNPWFPHSFRIDVSADGGKSWETVATSVGNLPTRTEPVLLELDEPKLARDVRLVITQHLPEGGGGNQWPNALGEVAIWGNWNPCLRASKPALELRPGATDDLSVVGAENQAVEWGSSDETVATVEDGHITAVALGQAVITANVEGVAETIQVPVSVLDNPPRVGDSLLVSVYYPLPLTHWADEENYQVLAAAGVDFLQPNSNMEVGARAAQLESARLAAKYGMQVSVTTDAFWNGSAPLTASDERIAEEVKQWVNIPGVGGFYLLDEPRGADTVTAWHRVYRAAKAAAPDYYPYLNFCGLGSCGVDAAMLDGWAQATSGRDYLMLDSYPFRSNGEFRWQAFYSNLNGLRTTALPYGMKTGWYLQTTDGAYGTLRLVNPDEHRFQVNSALAYGIKHLSYFTWWPTSEQGGGDGPGAPVTVEGLPNEPLYSAVTEMNAEAHALGPVLMRVEAEQVYLTGSNTYAQESLPAGFFVQPSSQSPFLFSYMRDRETGRNYVMVVNQSFTSTVANTLTFAPAIGSLEEISAADGQAAAVELEDNALTRTFAPGDAVLYQLPEDYDYAGATEVDKSDLQAAVTAGDSLVELDHTPESWAAFADALVAARAALASATASQWAVDGATTALTAAAVGLVLRSPGDSFDLDAVVTSRCMGGKAYLTVQALNENDFPAELSVSTAYGSIVFPQVAGGSFAFHSFATKAKNYGTGSVSVAGSGLGADPPSKTIEKGYPAAGC